MNCHGGMGVSQISASRPGGPTVLVIGASGLQGSAVCRHLIRAGYAVRGLTRDPHSKRAQAVGRIGAALFKGDLEVPRQLAEAMVGIDAVFAVFDPWSQGAQAEYRQAVAAIDAAQAAGVGHFVYSSVGAPDANNGVSHFASKWRIEQHLQASPLHWTILRPPAFMESLTEKKFVPPVLWHVWSQVSGWDTPLHWVAVDDIARAAVAALSEPMRHQAKVYTLAGDVCTLAQVRDTFAAVRGRRPWRLPMPVGLFRKWVSEELYRLFLWYRRGGFDAQTDELRVLVREPLTVHQWLSDLPR